MAQFNPKPIDLSQINGGNQLVNGDGLDADYINDTIEAAAYACEMVESTEVSVLNEREVAQLVADSLEVGSVTKAQDADVSINVVDGKAVIDFVIPTVGQDGQDGEDGATFTPSVSSAGVLSWSNDGGKENPPSVDIVAAVIAQLQVYDGAGD